VKLLFQDQSVYIAMFKLLLHYLICMGLIIEQDIIAVSIVLRNNYWKLQGLNLTCKGCDTTYNDTNVVLYLSKSTLKDLDAAANALLTDSSIIMNFAMSTAVVVIDAWKTE
jgi:hypothetical protein